VTAADDVHFRETTRRRANANLNPSYHEATIEAIPSSVMKLSEPDTDILIFEPGMVGHRLTWLRYITEDFLELGCKITWAVDFRPGAKDIIKEQLADILPKVAILSVFNDEGQWRGGNKLKSIEECQRISQAKQVFLNELDEVASNLLRRAALGIFPPHALKGRLSGVYFRPRFLTAPRRPIGNILKAFGFRRLCEQGWFRHIYLMDEYLFLSQKNKQEGLFYLLPDPWSGDYSCRSADARKVLDIPLNKIVFLHYGMGDRRKGLHLVIEALEASAENSGMFLLCAGKISHDRRLLEKFAVLERRGLAKLLNRYMFNEEERLCFCAADGVLLPYIHHYGSSGILSRAAAAGKMVIVSDEGLLAKRVRDHHLGLLFQTNDVHELRQCMRDVVLLNQTERDHFREMSLRYAETCSREAFRKALLAPWLSSIQYRDLN
jgi:glycosyltransferase involved in cell wall biosynthesis